MCLNDTLKFRLEFILKFIYLSISKIQTGNLGLETT